MDYQRLETKEPQLICSWCFWSGKSKSRGVVDHAKFFKALGQRVKSTPQEVGLQPRGHDCLRIFRSALATDRSWSANHHEDASENLRCVQSSNCGGCPRHRQRNLPRFTSIWSVVTRRKSLQLGGPTDNAYRITVVTIQTPSHPEGWSASEMSPYPPKKRRTN